MKTQSFLISLITALTSVVISAVALQAQLYLGVQGGIAISNQRHTYLNELTSFAPSVPLTYISRPQGGIIIGCQLDSAFALQTEVNYLIKGSEYPYQELTWISSPSTYATMLTFFGYFEVPLLLRYTLPQIVPSLDIHLLAGPSVGILESVYVKAYTDINPSPSNGLTRPLRSITDEQVRKEEFCSYEINVGGGIGLSYTIGNTGRIFCTGRYMMGLIDIEPSVNERVRNRALHLSLGYMLTL